MIQEHLLSRKEYETDVKEIQQGKYPAMEPGPCIVHVDKIRAGAEGIGQQELEIATDHGSEIDHRLLPCRGCEPAEEWKLTQQADQKILLPAVSYHFPFYLEGSILRNGGIQFIHAIQKISFLLLFQQADLSIIHIHKL